MRNLQEQVKKAFCYQKLFWPFTAWINCSSDLKSFSRSLEQFFLTVGQSNFGNKIPFSSLLITWFSFQTQSKVYFQARYLTIFRISLFWEQKSMLQKDYWTHDVISQNFTLQWAIFLWSSFFHLKYLQSSAPTKDATTRHYITHHSTFHYQIPPNPIRKGLDLSSSGVYEHLLLFLSMI